MHNCNKQMLAAVQRKAKKRRQRPKDAEEVALENALFGGDVGVTGGDDTTGLGGEMTFADDAAYNKNGGGGGGGTGDNVAGDASDENDNDNDDDDDEMAGMPLFVEDRVGEAAVDGDDDGGDARRAQAAAAAAEKAAAAPRKPAWTDADDDAVTIDLSTVNRLRKLREDDSEDVVTGTEYQQRLRAAFTELNGGVTDWAAAPSQKKKRKKTNANNDDDDDDDDDDADPERAEDWFLRESGGLTLSKADRRGADAAPAQGVLEIVRMRDANEEEPSKCVVQSIGWHPNSQLFFVAGFDKTLRFFSVDGARNRKVQSIFFPDLPIHKAVFTASGDEVIAAGRRKFFYSFDVRAGKVTKIGGIRGRDEKSLESFGGFKKKALLFHIYVPLPLLSNTHFLCAFFLPLRNVTGRPVACLSRK
jgi:hypothetical protein